MIDNKQYVDFSEKLKPMDGGGFLTATIFSQNIAACKRKHYFE